jgi:hypothetical protein
MAVHSVYLQFPAEAVRGLLQIYSRPDFVLQVIPAAGGCVVAVTTEDTRVWVQRLSHKKRVQRRINAMVTALSGHLGGAWQPRPAGEWGNA